MNSYTIEQCVERINARLAEEGLAATMNVRLLRHYQVQRAIDAPVQEGRFAKYSDKHVEDIVALRKAQGLGLSSKAYTTITNIQKQADYQDANTALDLDALYASSAPRTRTNPLGAVGACASTASLASSAPIANVFGNIDSSYLAASSHPTRAASLENTPLSNVGSLPTSSGSTDTNKQREAALRALADLGGVQGANSLERSMPAIHHSVSTATKSVSHIVSPAVSQPVLEWCLTNGVRVQMPNALHQNASPAKRKEFEAWLAQMPPLP